MEMFDHLKEMAAGAKGQQTTKMITDLLAQQGGVSGLVEKFHKGGLGELARSWVGTGANLPVNEQQLQSVIGNDTIQKLAGAAGIDPSHATAALAKFLPMFIDKMTPGGRISPATENPIVTKGDLHV